MEPTWGEFARYMITSGLVMSIGLFVILYIRIKWQTGAKALRRMFYWYLAAMFVIGLLSKFSEVSEVRCRGNPQEYCRYNDGVAVVATIVIVYFCTSMVRAMIVYGDR